MASPTRGADFMITDTTDPRAAETATPDEAPAPPSDAGPHPFRRYPARTEDSGHVREYFADAGERQYFEIFIWVHDGAPVRFDCHYDVQGDERLVSWRADEDRIHFMSADPAKEKPLGMKKSQTLTEAQDQELQGLCDALNERIAATAAAPQGADPELLRLLTLVADRLGRA